MAKDNNNNSYEEARKQRLQDNMKRFEDLGIAKMSKGLIEATKSSENKSPKNQVKSRSRTIPTSPEAVRRSSRPRSLVTSYQDEFHEEDRPLRKRSRSTSMSSTSYIARPLDEIKVATYEERAYAMKRAEIFQSNLNSGHPSCIKSMVRSHVYSCFWLGLPNTFCKKHLPSKEWRMVLEDETGLEYDAVYIGSRSGLSGGWRGFALDHKLDDGDAVLFELTEPARFKVYVFRPYDDEVGDVAAAELKQARETKSLNSKKAKKSDSDDDMDEEDVAEVTEVRKRKASKPKKPTRTKTTDGSAPPTLRQTRNSRKTATVDENNSVPISQELSSESEKETKESDKEAENVNEIAKEVKESDKEAENVNEIAKEVKEEAEEAAKQVDSKSVRKTRKTKMFRRRY